MLSLCVCVNKSTLTAHFKRTPVRLIYAGNHYAVEMVKLAKQENLAY